MENVLNENNKAVDGTANSKTHYESIQPLVVVASSLAAGIIIDRVTGLSIQWWWGLSASGWIGWWIVRRQHLDRFAALLLLTSVLALGGAWHHWCWHLFPNSDLGLSARETSQPVVLQAIALNGPRSFPAPKPSPLNPMARGVGTRLPLRILAIRNGMHWQPATGRVALFVEGQLNQVNAGDKLRIVAHLVRPNTPQNPGEFDAWSHHRADRILCRLYANHSECVNIVSKRYAVGIATLIERLRSHCNQILWNKLKHERRGLAAAVLLGAREQLDQERIEDFVVTGTIHLFAISGLHVGIMATGLFGLMRLGLLPKPLSLMLVVACVLLYALLTDARPPVVRAAFLISLLCWSQSLRRHASAFNSLAAAAILVLLINPVDLFRTGVQLSFLAVIALYWCTPRWNQFPSSDPLQPLLDASRPRILVWLRQQLPPCAKLAGTVALIWLVTLPLVMNQFHIFSPVAVVLNLVLWLPMSLALFSGFGLLVTDWLLPQAGDLCAWLCNLNLWLLETTVQSAKTWPGSHFWVSGPDTWWLFVFYAGLGWLAILPRLRPPTRWNCTVLVVWVGIGFGVSCWNRHTQQNKLDCTFVNVGHGTSVLLELPGGETILYDAGTLSSPIRATRSISSYLWSQGISHLDAIILSHADIDHYNAVPELLKRFDVGIIYCSPLMFKKVDPALELLRRSIYMTGIPIGQLASGNKLQVGTGVTIQVLHPPATGVIGSDNANSIVLQVSYRGRNILLPGDLEAAGLDAVIAETPRRFDLVMAPHHGSLNSDPEAFAKWSRPGLVVISSGHGHDICQVTKIYQQNGARVLNTADSGAIRVTVTKKNWEIHPWRQPP